MRNDIRKIIKSFLQKRNIETVEVDQIVSSLNDDDKLKWRDLGDREANYSTVHSADADVGLLLERITNSIDAYIEKFAKKYKEFENFNSPYDVINFLKEKNEEIHKDDIFVEIHKTKKFTNFLFWDNGVGLTNEEMTNTILSLNASNKFRKKYTMGSFGQGGSTVCGGNKYTIICSVKDTNLSFTIIRFNSLDDDEFAKQGKYEYLVSSEDDLPITIPFDEMKETFNSEINKGFKKDFFGTLVFHIEFEKNIIGREFYKVCDEILFNPAFAYKIGYFNRDKKDKPEQWNVKNMQGLKRRLINNVEENKILNKTTVSQYFNDGEEIVLTYYYLKDDKNGESQKVNRFLHDCKNPILVTFNGQVHGKFSRRLIEENAKLPQLKENLIIEVNCNKISNESKKKTFITDRQRLTNESRQKIKEEIVKFISDDPILLDEQSRKYSEEAAKGMQKGSEKMQEILAKMLKNNLLVGQISISGDEKTEGDGGSGGNGSGDGGKKKIIETKDFPTYIKITNQPPINAKIGKILTLNIESDLSNETSKYYQLKLIDESKKYIKKDSIQIDNFFGGRSRIRCALSNVAKIGKNFKVHVLLNSHKKDLISEGRVIFIIEENSGNKKNLRGSPEIKSVSKDDKKTYEIWKRVFNNEKDFAKYEETKNNIIIFINLSNKYYQSFIKKNKIKNIEKMKSHYSIFLAYSCFNLEHSKNLDSLFVGDKGESADESTINEFKNEALSVASSTILQLLIFHKLV